MRNITTIMIALLMAVSMAAAISSAAAASDSAGAAIAPSASGGSGYLGGPAGISSTGSSDGTKEKSDGGSPYLGGPAPSPCSVSDSVSCATITPTVAPPAISCSSVATDAAVSKCIKSTIQSGTLGAPAVDKETQQKRPTSSTSCILSPNPLSVQVNTKSTIAISCFSVDGEIACPGMSWSASIGTISGTSSGAGYKSSSTPGTGTISAAGIGSDGVAFSCASRVTVTSGAMPITSCTIAPSSLTIGTGGQQAFTVTCSSADGTAVPCTSDLSWSTDVGTLSPGPAKYQSIIFTAQAAAGTGSITAGGNNGAAASAKAEQPAPTHYSCTAPITVTAATPVATSCSLSPSSLTIGTNQQQTFTVACSNDAGDAVPCPDNMAWSATIGSIAAPRDPPTSATFSSGSTAGTGVVRANGRALQDSAVGTFNCQSPVTVTSTPVIIYSCAISPSSLSIQVNGQQTFVVTCYDRAGATVRCSSDLAWNTDVGTLSPGPAKYQSIIFTAQAAAGTGSITAGGSSTGSAAPTAYSCTAPITVTASPAQVASIRLVPKALTIAVGQTQQFIAKAYDSNGNYIRDLSNGEVGWSILSITVANVGSIDKNGVFTALGAGSTTVRGTYNAITPSAIIYSDAPVTVINGSTGQVSSITLAPSSASLYIGQTQQFTAMAFDASGNFLRNLTQSEVAWAIDNPGVGKTDENGLFRAVGVGATNITATYNSPSPSSVIGGRALISVSSAPITPGGSGGNGGSGGSSNGGGAFRTSTTASFTCAGKGGMLTITYYDSKAPSATVDVFYKGDRIEKVFSQTISSTTTMSFTPQKEGLYELHVSIGTDQTTADFSVPSCTPSTANVTQNVTVQLEPVRELVLKRSVDYKGGFSKEFRVYKITAGGSAEYSTEVDLYYTYTGNGSANLTVTDGVPKSVLSRASQVSFSTYPGKIESDPQILFEWYAKGVKSGDRLKYSYSFARQLTSAMIDSFAAPSSMTDAERQAIAGGQKGTGSDILASMISIGGMSIQISLVLVVLAMLLLIALIYLFVFGKKKE